MVDERSAVNQTGSGQADGAGVSRRKLLKAASVALGGIALASCTRAETPEAATPTSAAGGAEGTAAAGGATGEALGAPETTDISFAVSNPNYASQAVYYIAEEFGFWEDQGFSSMRVDNLDQPIQAVLTGGATFGAADTDETILAVQDGADVRALGCIRDRELVLVALAPGVETPQDAMGQPAIIYTPGTRNFNARADILRDWGLGNPEEDLELVELSGGSDAWLQALLAGQAAIATLFSRHIQSVLDAGGTVLPPVLLDVPQEVLVASTEFIEANPNTIANMWVAQIRARDVWYDQNRVDEVLELMRDRNFEITDEFVQAHAQQVEQWSPDGGFRMSSAAAFIKQMVDVDLVPSDFRYEDFMDLGALHAAQASLGRSVWPPPADESEMSRFNLI